MIVSRYVLYFVVFSFLGWIWETMYCTIFDKKWANRGFLIGPICPIYGVAAGAGMILLDILAAKGIEMFPWWQIALISFFGSAVLEYSTHWLLEKCFHASWWDYSMMPLNLHGRICLPASLGFAGAGVFIEYIFGPWLRDLVMCIPPILTEVLSLVVIAILAADTTMTISILTDFTRRLYSADQRFQNYMEELVGSIDKDFFYAKTIGRVKRLKYDHLDKVQLQNALTRLKKLGPSHWKNVRRHRHANHRTKA